MSVFAECGDGSSSSIFLASLRASVATRSLALVVPCSVESLYLSVGVCAITLIDDYDFVIVDILFIASSDLRLYIPCYSPSYCCIAI